MTARAGKAERRIGVALAAPVEDRFGDALNRRLDQLSAIGLPIGPRERAEAVAVAAELLAGGGISTLDDFEPYLAPLVCRNAAQLALYRAHAPSSARKPLKQRARSRRVAGRTENEALEEFVFEADPAAPAPIAAPPPGISRRGSAASRYWAFSGVALAAAMAVGVWIWGDDIRSRLPRSEPEPPISKSEPPAPETTASAPPPKEAIKEPTAAEQAAPEPPSRNETAQAPQPSPSPVVELEEPPPPAPPSAASRPTEALPVAVVQATKRIVEAARKLDGGAPTLESLSAELLAADEATLPEDWSGPSLAIALHELSGAPMRRPLDIFGIRSRILRSDASSDGAAEATWPWGARLALALDRLRRPGLESPPRLYLRAFEDETRADWSEAASPPAMVGAARWALDAAADASGSDVERARARLTAAAERLADGGERERLLRVAAPLTLVPDPPPPPGIADHFPWAPLLPMALLAALALLWTAPRILDRQGWLRQRPPKASPLLTELVVDAAKAVWSATHAERRAALLLTTRGLQTSELIDVDATVRGSLRQGGQIIEPKFRFLRPAPEYLTLIERRTAGDQRARYMRELLANYEDLSHFHVYYYQRDPGMLQPESGDAPVSIEALRARYPEHRLLVLGSGRGMFEVGDDPALLPGAAALAAWRDRVVLTPMAVSSWDGTEELLADRLAAPVGRATRAGFVRLGLMFGLGGERLEPGAYPEGDGANPSLPPKLHQRRRRWFWNAPPSSDPPERIVADLEESLDRETFNWLCALAIYPSLQWELTLFLGKECGYYSDDRLAALVQLPWLVEGRMPQWMRAALLRELPDEEAGKAFVQIQMLLALAEARKSEREAKLEVAYERGRPVDPTPMRKLGQDRVFIDFIERGQVGDFPLPEGLRVSGLRTLAPRLVRAPVLRRLTAGALLAASAYAVTPDLSEPETIFAWTPLVALLALSLLLFVSAPPPRRANGPRAGDADLLGRFVGLELGGAISIGALALGANAWVHTAHPPPERIEPIHSAIYVRPASGDGGVWARIHEGGALGTSARFAFVAEAHPDLAPVVEALRTELRESPVAFDAAPEVIAALADHAFRRAVLGPTSTEQALASEITPLIARLRAAAAFIQLPAAASTPEGFVLSEQSAAGAARLATFDGGSWRDLPIFAPATALATLDTKRVLVGRLDGRIQLLTLGGDGPDLSEPYAETLPGRVRLFLLDRSKDAFTAVADDGTAVEGSLSDPARPLERVAALPAFALGSAIEWKGEEETTVKPAPQPVEDPAPPSEDPPKAPEDPPKAPEDASSEADRAELARTQADLRETRRAARDVASALRDTRAESERLQKTLDQMAARREAAAIRLRQTEANAARLQAEIDSLRDAFVRANKSVAAIDPKAIIAATPPAPRGDAPAADAKPADAELRGAPIAPQTSKEAEATPATLAETQSQLDTARKSLSAAQRDLAQARARRSSLTAESEIQNELAQRAEARTRRADAAFANLVSERDQLRADLARAQRTLARLEAQRASRAEAAWETLKDGFNAAALEEFIKETADPNRVALAEARLREVYRTAQLELQRLSHYTSTVDGLWGPGSRRAMIAFERQAGRPETGQVTDEIIAALQATETPKPATREATRASEPAAELPSATTPSAAGAAPAAGSATPPSSPTDDALERAQGVWRYRGNGSITQVEVIVSGQSFEGSISHRRKGPLRFEGRIGSDLTLIVRRVRPGRWQGNTTLADWTVSGKLPQVSAQNRGTGTDSSLGPFTLSQEGGGGR